MLPHRVADFICSPYATTNHITCIFEPASRNCDSSMSTSIRNYFDRHIKKTKYTRSILPLVDFIIFQFSLVHEMILLFILLLKGQFMWILTNLSNPALLFVKFRAHPCSYKAQELVQFHSSTVFNSRSSNPERVEGSHSTQGICHDTLRACGLATMHLAYNSMSGFPCSFPPHETGPQDYPLPQKFWTSNFPHCPSSTPPKSVPKPPLHLPGRVSGRRGYFR